MALDPTYGSYGNSDVELTSNETCHLCAAVNETNLDRMPTVV